jgi:hypothetical protein
MKQRNKTPKKTGQPGGLSGTFRLPGRILVGKESLKPFDQNGRGIVMPT